MALINVRSVTNETFIRHDFTVSDMQLLTETNTFNLTQSWGDQSAHSTVGERNVSLARWLGSLYVLLAVIYFSFIAPLPICNPRLITDKTMFFFD